MAAGRVRAPHKDKFGVWNVYDKPVPRNERFDREVELKVARSAGVGGWQHGPIYIIEQAAEEPVDAPSWLTGLQEYEKPAGLDERLEKIHRKAADLWQDIEDLKDLYE